MSAAQSVFFTLVTLGIALGVSLAGVAYFRLVTLPRPAVGAFNGNDMVIMMGFVIALPFLYLALPGALLPPVLGLTLAGGLAVAYGPVVEAPGSGGFSSPRSSRPTGSPRAPPHTTRPMRCRTG